MKSIRNSALKLSHLLIPMQEKPAKHAETYKYLKDKKKLFPYKWNLC